MDERHLAPAVITLTTDFGESSRYVAAMKGVILSINPRARLVDLSHSVPHQNIRQGAIVLAETAPYFPPESIHVAVVDPGVGTGRRIVFARIGTQQFIAPDNGLLSRLAAASPPSKIIGLDEPRFWLPRVSSTFQGRDIMAPVAARLSLGLSPDELGRPLDELTELSCPEVQRVANKIEGEVVEVDSFGNLITNITRDMLAGVPTDESVTIECDEHTTQGIFRAYEDQPAMTLVALIGSSDHLELAIVGDTAAIMLGVTVGTPVQVKW
jgi:S-adenosyl-L-methionine hydrolase (adenosine-forming)